MYPNLSLYNHYLKRSYGLSFSSDFPDVTKRTTLNNMNYAVNICDDWSNFLDIGGGNGHYSTALSAIFNNGTIVEVEALKEHLELTKKYPNIHIYNDFIENYETKDTFDFILLSDIFEHIPNIKSFIEKISDFQKVGGVIYILTPNPIFCAPATKSGLYFTKHPNGHIKHYTLSEITDLMSQFGYTLIFSIFEENYFRQKVKRFIQGISRRNNKWKNKIIYKLIHPIIIFSLYPIIKILDLLTYRNEKRSNKFNAISQGLTFKKI